MDLTLLVAMLLHSASCHAGLRARDPDVEEEMQGLMDQEPSTFGTAQFPIPHGYRHHSTAGPVHAPLSIPEGPVTPMSVSSEQPARTGYHLSSRPVYRQKQKIFTALHWKCCSGHGGHNCQETEGESQSGQEHKEKTQTEISGDDSGGKDTDLLEDGGWHDSPGQQPSSNPVFPAPGHLSTGAAIPPSASLPFMDSTTLLTAHQIFAAMMTQLQPVLDGFNRSLEHLSSEVEGLSVELQKLRHRQEGQVYNSGHVHPGRVEKKLEDSFAQIRQIESQLNFQQKQIEQTVQSQEELLQYNFPKLREEIEHHMNQSHEGVQVSLQSLSQSVEEIRLIQKNQEGLLQREHTAPVYVSKGQPGPVSDVWDVISRLDQKVQKNTIDLSALSKATQFMTVSQKLDRSLQNLSLRLEQVSQSSEIHYAEIELELEAAKTTALNSVSELASNLSSQEQQMRELELYLDSIYEQVQKNEPTRAEACNCKEISKSLIALDLKVTNVTDLAKKNQYALEDVEARRSQGHWSMQVDDLHQALLSVKESLAFEQAKSRSLTDKLSELKTSLLGSQREIIGLKESLVAKASEIRDFSSSFTSLLKDTIRHSEVLEVLLGDEVMEFSSWSESQQKELSIPVLLQKLKLMQEKIESHKDSLASLKRNGRERDQMASDDPLPYIDLSLTEDQVRNTDEDFSPGPSTGDDEDDDGDYTVSDFWSLGREVEELAGRISRLEQQYSNCTAGPGGSVTELQREVLSLRQTLGDHLKIFQNLFSYTEELVNSSRTLNLDQVWAMIRRKDRKRNRGENMKDKESDRIRRKRNTGSGSSWSSMELVTGLQHRTSTERTLLHKKVDLNHGSAYRTSAEFHVPQTGLYLFVVTLNFEKGPCLAQLKHGKVPVASMAQDQGKGGPLSRACLLVLEKGEKVSLELIEGRLRQGPINDNTLSGILLFRTDDIDGL